MDGWKKQTKTRASKKKKKEIVKLTCDPIGLIGFDIFQEILVKGSFKNNSDIQC